MTCNASEFKQTIDDIFTHLHKEHAATRDEYKIQLEDPISCLADLHVGDEYMVRIRGQIDRHSARLDDVVISVKKGISFVFSRIVLGTFISKTTKEFRLPQKINQDDVWIYYTPLQIQAKVLAYNPFHSGMNTPNTASSATPNSSLRGTMSISERSQRTATTTATATTVADELERIQSGTITPSMSGTQTPSSVTSRDQSLHGLSQSGQSGEHTPNSMRGTMTPSIQSTGTPSRPSSPTLSARTGGSAADAAKAFSLDGLAIPHKTAANITHKQIHAYGVPLLRSRI